MQVENANKFFDFEGPKASKLSAMSLTDLSGEAEKSLLGNRSSLFNSVQNISGLASNLNGKSKCKINKDKSLQSDAFQMVQLNRGSKVLDESTETDALKK